jgi:uncharacterized protein (DUF4415 family)
VRENKRVIHTDLAKLDAHEIQPEEYEDIPELTEEFFEKADFYIGEKLIRRGRGRPPLDAPKKLVSLRLDQDVIDRFRAGGPGWQSRINAVLRKHLWGDQG